MASGAAKDRKTRVLKPTSSKFAAGEGEPTQRQLGANANAKANEPAGAAAREAARSDEEEEETAGFATILRELRDFRQDNNRQLQEIKGEIDKTNSRLTDAEARISANEDRLQQVEEVLAVMMTSHEALQQRITSLEGYGRRSNIRIYGVKEGSEPPGPMIPFVEKLLKENLGIPEGRALQIQRAHRASAPLPDKDRPPRSIVVNFLNFIDKDEVLKLAWQKKGFMWQNQRVNIDHDYPPGILAKRKEYADSRRVLKEKDIRFQTLYPARLKVHHVDGVRIYDTVEEATADLANRGLPVKVIKEPASLWERISKEAWHKARGGNQSTRRSRASGYKEKLKAFRRDDTE